MSGMTEDQYWDQVREREKADYVILRLLRFIENIVVFCVCQVTELERKIRRLEQEKIDQEEQVYG